MSRPTKEVLMAKLTEQGKTFDPDENYNFLWDKLDEGTEFPYVVKREDGTKLEVSKELYDRARSAGISHKEIGAYADAAALLLHLDNFSPLVLEEIPLPEVPEEIEVKDGETVLFKITKAILDRTKKIGVAFDSLKAHASRDALVEYLNKIHPVSNPAAKPKVAKVPAYSQHKPMEDKFEIESKMEAKFISQNRAQFDEGKLQEELRRINRVHGPGQPVKIVKTSTFKPVNGVNKKKLAVKYLVTTYEIFMK